MGRILFYWVNVAKREESRAEHKTLTNGDKDPDKILSLSECSGRG